MTHLKIIKDVYDHKVSEEAIKEFEATINAKLPDDYVQFLLQHNGARVEPARFKYIPISGCSGKQEKSSETLRVNTIQEILGISLLPNDLGGSLQWSYEVSKISYPEKLIPIGFTWNGDQICLSISGTDYGCVYLWQHDGLFDDDEELDECYNVYYLSDSFTDFLAILY